MRRRNFLQDIKLLFRRLTTLESSVGNRKVRYLTELGDEWVEVTSKITPDDDVIVMYSVDGLADLSLPPLTDDLIGKEYIISHTATAGFGTIAVNSVGDDIIIRRGGGDTTSIQFATTDTHSFIGTPAGWVHTSTTAKFANDNG